ncbi:MAG: alpha/beta hydrolase [Chloroflexi bacterium]|nr:alpha/beta hydrolase [Chloroflexota bacterium]
MTEAANAFRTRPISQHFEANGLRLHFLDWGEEAPTQLLLLHGLSSNAHTWDDFAKEAHTSYRIVAADLRGHGESGHAADGYTLERFAADLKALARHLNARRFHLMGASLGALIAIYFASENPRMVQKLVLEDGGPGLDMTAARQGAEARFRRPFGFDTPEEAQAWLRSAYPRDAEERVKARFQYGMKQNWAGKWVLREDPDLFWVLGGYQKAAEEMDGMGDRLKSLECPVLLVHGQESVLMSAEAAERIAGAAPHCEVAHIPGAGHSVHSDQPELFRQAVARFLT